MKRYWPYLLITLAACAPAAAPTPAPTPVEAAAERRMPNDVHWTRNSAEHHALYIQTYRAAGDQLRELARAERPGSWGVILDADETVIDNSAYQMERAAQGLGYTSESWNTWALAGRATLLPGAAEFIALVRELGGRVAIVTNRRENTCPATRENFRTLGITVDVMLCRTDDEDKNARFQAVQNGTALPGLPPLKVLMWVGDNIQDFPHLTQALRESPAAQYAPFGRTFFVLPNPMYGSWERNPQK